MNTLVVVLCIVLVVYFAISSREVLAKCMNILVGKESHLNLGKLHLILVGQHTANMNFH